MTTSAEKPIKLVVISSTTQDLLEHRVKVMDACLRQDMFPKMMEHLPTNGDDAIKASLKLVDEADLYIGIFAYRYGYVPEGHDLSITEMEYNHAVKRNIPRLIFIMHDEHPIKGSDVEKGAGAIKIEALKERMKKAQVVNFFKSPEELAKHVINSLAQYRHSDLTAFHAISTIPQPPEAYIAHPYVLLQTRLLGRRNELNRLTNWVTRSGSDIYQARILSIVAIGGMGKSALTWKWFNDIAPYEMRPLAGRLWWSFYESDASFENFVIRALAYVSRRSKEDIRKLSPQEREEELFDILNREPFLIVLDGLERIMVAYARMDAARLADDDLDQKTANKIADRLGLPESAAQSFTGQSRLRKAADPHVGRFLRKLTQLQASRILVSTRLYPAELQTSGGSEVRGSKSIFLRGLEDEDALEMWRAFRVNGSRETLLPLFHTFDNHPLLIQALAGLIAQDRRFSGDFESWRKAHSAFNPFNERRLVGTQSHILEFALHGLDQSGRHVLSTLACFRMPVKYDTLVALFVGNDKPFCTSSELITVLDDLEDRALVGWNRRDNRYDLHPIVRGVAWNVLNENAKRDVYQTLYAHFESITMLPESQEINTVDDLAPLIERYNTLIGLERYEDAYLLYKDRLQDVMLYDLSSCRHVKEILEMLFPDGLDRLPCLKSLDSQSIVLNDLALSINDQLQKSVEMMRRCIEIDQRRSNISFLSTDLGNLSRYLWASGAIYESEVAICRALPMTRQIGDRFQETWCLYLLGGLLADRGIKLASARAFHRSLKILLGGYVDRVANVYGELSTYSLRDKHYVRAELLADQARKFNEQNHYEWGIIRAIRLQGEVALKRDKLSIAEEHFRHALVRARNAGVMGDELTILLWLAKLRLRQGDLKSAREFLDDTWEAAERGPLRILQAEAFNVLTQIERDAGNHKAAIEAATLTYRHSWCDGPPYAYYWGLEDAKAHLAALKAPLPIMPPFDASRYEPMPEVEIDPRDEFYVGNQKLENFLRELGFE
ncbi:MAG: DUF4062 domain-containing protein [Ktedonobacteraceae bacterium]|nr:DUF4062 domain-containing protein [Ktedonobacteraceae bacterium]